MQFSYHWLKTWVNVHQNAEELAHLLTMAGLEVEETQTVAPAFTGVVVAQVKSVEPHPNADRLRVTQVDVGQGELLQIVCGAPNVAVGVKVPCAMAGACLPNDFNIQPTKMRGEVSNGMLCSARELGLPDEVDGLLILPDDAPIGQNIREYLDLDDTLLTLKITPNRADCLGIKGIAREVKALTNCELNPLSVPKTPRAISRIFPTYIDAPKACKRFLTRVIEGVDAKTPTPEWIRQRLLRSGIRSISILVDIGNYVMLELGQPMHVFDADKISGSLTARYAKDGETLQCLNGKEVTLTENTLVIADEKQAVSLAGLMGGEATSVSDKTQNIVLESAFFDPNVIAGKARQYGFGSDSSFRFERGVDFELQEEAIERASGLIIGLCGGRCGEINHVQTTLPEKSQIHVRIQRVKKLLGIDIAPERIQEILQNLGLNPVATEAGFSVTVPSFRFDLAIEADIIEEIARVYGFENIRADTPLGHLAMIPLPENQKNRFSIYQNLADYGYTEVINYAFVDEVWEQDFAYNPKPIRLQNPIASHMSVMRSTLIGGLIETLRKNINRKQNRIRLFEVARTFHRVADEEYQQKEHIGLLAFGQVLPEQWGSDNRRVDFFDVKVDVEKLIGRPVVFKVFEHIALHPGRSAQISTTDGQVIGFIGELHPKWVQKYELPYAPIVAELLLSAVLEQDKVQYVPVSKFPSVRRDLAFVVAELVTSDMLLSTLLSHSSDIVQNIELFDIYRGVGLPEGYKSMAVKITLLDQEKTLLEQEIEEEITKLIKVAEEQCQAKLRQ